MRKFLDQITLRNGSVQGLNFDYIALSDLPAGIGGDSAQKDQANVFTVGPQTFNAMNSQITLGVQVQTLTYPFTLSDNALFGRAQFVATLIAPLTEPTTASDVNSGLVSLVTVDPVSDDPVFNEWSAICGIAHVPASNSKVIYDIYGLQGIALYEGGNGPDAEVIAVVGDAQSTAANTEDVVGGSFQSSTYADTARVLGTYSLAFVFGGTTGQVAGQYYTLGIYFGATVTNAASIWIPTPFVAGTVTTSIFGIYIADQTQANAANAYAFWYDSPGVTRIKADGVFAHYNANFTKYTPGATAFERIVVQWDLTHDIAEIGAEKGTTGGTLRAMRLFGASVQVAAEGSSGPDASAVFEADSTTQGFLPPRMTTTQRTAISSPAEGLIVYDATAHKLYVRTAAAWEQITSV